MKTGKTPFFAVAAVTAIAAVTSFADEAGVTYLEWKDIVGTNRAPVSVSSAVCQVAVSAVTGSEEESPEFRLNTNPPGFCLYVR